MSDEPLKLHRSTKYITTDDAPEWTRQFEHHIADTARQAVLNAQHKWFCWWEDDYIVNILYNHFDNDAVWAVVEVAYGADRQEIADEIERSPSWIDRWTARIEAYVRFHLSPSRDKPKRFSDIA